MRHVGGQFVAHGAVTGVADAGVALVVEQHQFAEKRAAQAGRLHAQPVFVRQRLGEQGVTGGRRGGDRYAFIAGQGIGGAILHQPGAEPGVAILRAVDGCPVQFMLYPDSGKRRGLE